MKETKTKVCPVCGKEILPQSGTTTCPQCGVVHHKGCWEKNNGCCTVGCIAGGKFRRDIKEIARMQHSAYKNSIVNENKVSPPPAVHKEKPKRNNNDIKQTVRSKEDRIDNRNNNVKQTFEKQQTVSEKANVPQRSIQNEQHRQEVIRHGKYAGYTAENRMDEFMQALIQKNVYYYDQKFSMINLSGKSNTWNWASFFLGSFWLIYRKMYLNALWFYLITLGIGLLNFIPVVGSILALLLCVAVWVFMGLFGNALYKKHLEKIYNENAGLDYDQRKQESISKGGTSVLSVVLYIIIMSLLNMIVISLITALGFFGSLGAMSLYLR